MYLWSNTPIINNAYIMSFNRNDSTVGYSNLEQVYEFPTRCLKD